MSVLQSWVGVCVCHNQFHRVCEKVAEELYFLAKIVQTHKTYLQTLWIPPTFGSRVLPRITLRPTLLSLVCMNSIGSITSKVQDMYSSRVPFILLLPFTCLKNGFFKLFKKGNNVCNLFLSLVLLEYFVLSFVSLQYFVWFWLAFKKLLGTEPRLEHL